MPAHLSDPACMGIKVISVFPGNHGTELDSHQGAVLLFETERGRLLAIMDASSITAIRTAAVSGVATRLLARPEAGARALLGSGVQAATHLEAMALVRPLQRVRVWSRDAAHAARLAAAARAGIPSRWGGGQRAGGSEGADIVCTVTSSRTPVLEGEWLRPARTSTPWGPAWPPRGARHGGGGRARVYVDRRESAPTRPVTSSSRARRERSATTTCGARSAT